MSHPKTWSNLFSGRGDGIRTCDFKLMRLASLPTALLRDVGAIITTPVRLN